MNLFSYYMRNRIFIITDLVLIIVPVLTLIIGWHWLTTTLSLPVTIFGVCVVGAVACIGVVSLADRVYIRQARHHVDLMVYRRQQLALPLSSLGVEEIEEETRVLGQPSQQSPGGGTLLGTPGLSQHVPTSPIEKQSDSDNAVVARMLVDNPNMSIRQMERETGISRASIGRTPAWQNRTTYR